MRLQTLAPTPTPTPTLTRTRTRTRSFRSSSTLTLILSLAPNLSLTACPIPNQVVSCVFKPGLFQPHLVNQEGARRLSGKFRALLS